MDAQPSDGAERSIRERIKKLLALAESDYEHEAESALLKAQQLMGMHGLSAESVAAPEQGEAQKREVATESVGWSGRLPFWQKQLALVIAENFRCHVYTDIDEFGADSLRCFKLIGLSDDVEVAADVLAFGFCYAEMSWQRFRKNVRSPDRYTTNRVKEDYFAGFIKGLREKFAEQVSEKGLMIIKDQLVEESYADLKLRTSYVRTRGGAGSKRAWQTGHRDGKSMERDRFVE